jgi:hypothetical protein
LTIIIHSLIHSSILTGSPGAWLPNIMGRNLVIPQSTLLVDPSSRNPIIQIPYMLGHCYWPSSVIHLSIHPPIHPSIHPSIHPYIHPSVMLYVFRGHG